MAEAPQVDVGQARTFLSSIGHTPDAVKAMPDADVTKIYTGATEYLTKEFAPKAVPFGEKWREALAGDDKDAMATLGRFKTPSDLWARTKELTTKLSSGELKSTAPYPVKGTPEQQSEWRKAQGIPEKPEAYDTKLEGGIVIGEQDKPMVDGFLKFAHANNMPPEAVKGNLQWYFGEFIPAQQKAVAEQTKLRETETEKALREQWGADYKRNMTAAENMVARFFPKDDEKNGNVQSRTVNAIKQDPAFAAVMATLALEIDPTTATGSGAGHDSLQSVDVRIGEIEGLMRKDRAAYNRDEKMQEEYRQLLSAKERFQAKTK